jgi:hypothetical protein
MTGIAKALRWVARLDGLVALILGIVLWTGAAVSLRMHIATGFIMTLTLLLMALLGFFAKLKPVLPLIAIIWAILLPYVGFIQLRVLPGASLATIQVIHLLIGICAIGLAEALGARIQRQAGS